MKWSFGRNHKIVKEDQKTEYVWKITPALVSHSLDLLKRMIKT